MKLGQLKGGDIVIYPEQTELERKSDCDVALSSMQAAVFEHTFTLQLADPLALIEALIGAKLSDDYYVYEKPASGLWHIALGIQAALVITSTEVTETNRDQPPVHYPLQGEVSDLARRFVKSHEVKGWNIFGQAAFEYAAHIRDVSDSLHPSKEKWPLLSLVLPYSEIVINQNHVGVRTRDITTLAKLQTLLTSEVQRQGEYTMSPLDTHCGKAKHQKAAQTVLDEIHSGRCEKITLSRQVEVPERINMLGTYLQSRPIHTPSRSYLVKCMGREVMGFSPELIVAVNGRAVLTEPVAGTRALHSSLADNAQLRHDLQSDPKEIVEHAISVREAVREMELFSENVVVNKFMTTIERGSVQHLASEVRGVLKQDKDAWHAFDELFPSITASGIPKAESIEAILRIEEAPRGLYSGAILMLNQKEFEACLVLRSAFQDTAKSWIQAGCGMVGLSIPEREFTETVEKFAGIAPYIVCEN